MANNNTLWSAKLQIKKAHFQWALDFFQYVNDRADEVLEGEEYHKDFEPILQGIIKHHPNIFEAGGFAFTEEDDDNGEKRIWFYSAEGDNLDLLLESVKALFVFFNLDDVFDISWAYTCSRPLINAFGGGTAAVCRLAIISSDSSVLTAAHNEHVRRILFYSKNSSDVPFK